MSPAGERPKRTAGDRVIAFLRQHPGETWCADCVARHLDLSRSRVANVFLAGEGHRDFRRADAVCKGCGRRRLGLRYALPSKEMPAPGVMLCAVCSEGIVHPSELVIVDAAPMHAACARESGRG